MDSKPLFKELTQVGFVVKDCRATAKRYWDEFGIGPWEFYTLDPSNTPDMTLRGRAVEHAFRAALAKVGDVGFESVVVAGTVLEYVVTGAVVVEVWVVV